ncbi:MAG: cyclic nucleotide-binding domain-containing protein [bacterium]|nr:cyclic nucleotide-binding domain-containing protein [bacterium]
MLNDDVELLRKMAVFGGMNRPALELVLGAGRELQQPSGTYFFREGDPGESLFILRSGNVAIERLWQEQVIPLGELHAGDCFGEMSLIDLMPRSASVRAAMDCLALEIPQRCLYRLYQHDLEQYAIFMMNMGREVSRRLRIADERLFALEKQLPEFRP